MTESITIFNAKKTTTKYPGSPYDDNTFVFETHNIQTNSQFYSVLVSHFVLNIPLEKLQKPIRTFRRKVNIESYYGECIKYLILDIDDVKSEFDKQKILEYFKDYKCILGESKSYNGIDNYNMKGILFTECIHFGDAKLALSEIAHDLMKYCIIDESVVRMATYNAPILKNNVFFNNEDGIRYKYTKQSAIEHINMVKSEYLENTTDSLKIDMSEIQNIEADTIEKLCLKVFQQMGFCAIKNNGNDSISFKHPSEKKSPGGYFWFESSPYTMHHGNTTKCINIFDTIRKLDIGKELMKKNIDYNDEFLNFNTNNNIITVDETYLTLTDEIRKTIDIYLNHKNGLLSIRSPMGTGKSTIIKGIIEECHDLDMKVLIITNRISVAQDFSKKYGLKLYNKDEYNIGDSLVVQFDSLWRYNVKFFDIVIMDEFISLMTHSRSNLNNSSVNISKFFGCFNKKLVIADAFLTGYENFLLSNKETNLHLIDNVYRDPTTLYSYDVENMFVDSILVHAKKNKITVSATSLNFINSLASLLRNQNLKVVTLTAETPQSTKELVYNLFEEAEHDKWDVLIYSPTLTVGVSNLNNVYYHFHYDSSSSTDVISSIQMIKRTRKSKEIHMYIKEKINYLKTSYNDIRDEYMGNIGRNIEHNYLFDMDEYGEARLSEIGKKAIKIDTFKNILEFDHKKAMMWLLKYHFRKEPITIKESDRIKYRLNNSNLLYEYSKEIKESKDRLLKDNIQQFLELNEMEKTSALIDADADKTMKVLAGINEHIKDCPSEIKTKLLELSLNDKNFIQKCLYYRVVFNYTKQIWDESDVKNLISKSVINSSADDLNFYNALLKYGQKEIFDEYYLKSINANKTLKFLLDKCGYGAEKQGSGEGRLLGMRSYLLDKNIKDLYGYIQ